MHICPFRLYRLACVIQRFLTGGTRKQSRWFTIEFGRNKCFFFKLINKNSILKNVKNPIVQYRLQYIRKKFYELGLRTFFFIYLYNNTAHSMQLINDIEQNTCEEQQANPSKILIYNFKFFSYSPSPHPPFNLNVKNVYNRKHASDRTRTVKS